MVLGFRRQRTLEFRHVTHACSWVAILTPKGIALTNSFKRAKIMTICCAWGSMFAMLFNAALYLGDHRAKPHLSR